MPNKYYFFYLELALNEKKDTNVYAFKNVSHIPTSKLIEIFEIDLKKDPYILEGYFLTKKIYKKHKQYLRENVGQINLKVFEYSLRQFVSDDFTSIRKLYKQDLLE